MMDEGICVGCGGECLDVMECSCGRQEVYACQDCLDSDMTLVCGVCRDRASQVVPLSLYPCGGFQDDEAAAARGMGGVLPVTAAVGAWGVSYRAG